MPVKPETMRKFIELVARLDDHQLEVLSGLMDVAKAQRGTVPVKAGTKRLGTGPLLNRNNN